LRDTPPVLDAIDWNDPFAQRFKLAMDDDFNTADATAVLFDLATQVNRSRSGREAGLLRALGGVLGLIQRDPVQFLQGGSLASDELSAAQIEAQIEQRKAARKAKNFAEADRIRDVLLQAGVLLEDGAGGTTWRRV
jgi:cysteinyl-tRNA synthetase